MVLYGPNGTTAKVVETSNSYDIIITYPNGQNTIYTSNGIVTTDSIYVTVYRGPNGGKAIFITDNNGQKALEVTTPNGNVILFTVNNPQTYNPDYINNTTHGTSNSYTYPPATSTNNVTSTVYYGPYGATARVVESANSYMVIVTYPNGQTTIYTSNNVVTLNTVYVTIYYGQNGGKAVFITGNNGQQALEITMPNGNIVMFTVTPNTNTNTNTNTNSYDSSANVYPLSSSTSSNTSTNAYPTSSTMGTTMGGTTNGYNYSSSLPPGIPASQIPPGSEDLYILKSEVVPPVCPVCPSITTSVERQETCPPCPACARCPQSNFECKKVPNYNTLAEEYIPVPVLNDFSQFGM